MATSKKLINIRKLKILADAKKPVEQFVGPEMKYVQENTMRAINNLMTRPGEFVYASGRPVRKGVYYHCHYTINFEEYFMTGARHNPKSQMIYKVDKQTDVNNYVSAYGAPTKLAIPSKVTTPTSDDYQKGFMKRYFAKKVNEDSRPFEISVDNFNKSPLYEYVQVVWYIKGGRQAVQERNILSVAGAESIVAGVGRLLPDFQYFQATEVIDRQSRVRELLGIPEPK